MMAVLARLDLNVIWLIVYTGLQSESDVQWGKTSSSGRATTSFTFPIAFSSSFYNITISQAGASDTWSTYAHSTSTTGATLGNNYGSGSWWMAVGK